MADVVAVASWDRPILRVAIVYLDAGLLGRVLDLTERPAPAGARAAGLLARHLLVHRTQHLPPQVNIVTVPVQVSPAVLHASGAASGVGAASTGGDGASGSGSGASMSGVERSEHLPCTQYCLLQRTLIRGIARRTRGRLRAVAARQHAEDGCAKAKRAHAEMIRSYTRRHPRAGHGPLLSR
jgi:hypothetical protein